MWNYLKKSNAGPGVGKPLEAILAQLELAGKLKNQRELLGAVASSASDYCSSAVSVLNLILKTCHMKMGYSAYRMRP